MLGAKTIHKIKSLILKALNSDLSAEKLALSFSIGIFIAFSPFPGAHTLMMFGIQWLLKLNFPILFIATSFNNPWTMIPFFSGDYAFGYWFTHYILGWHPTWVISLEKIFGSGSICLWSFLIGGNILGILCGLISYPIMIPIFKRWQKKQLCRKINNENY